MDRWQADSHQINADTNPTNWGVREDGTIVLFDWELLMILLKR